MKATIAAYWACASTDISNPSSYFAWDAAKFSVRGIAAAFLMGLFLKVDARTVPMGNLNVEMNHFLVPTVMLTIFGKFVETLIDQYVGPEKTQVGKRIKFILISNAFSL